MKNPSDTIEQNFEALATEMMDLQVCSSRVVRKEPKRMDEWLERKYSSTIDFVEIKREWNKLKGDHLNNLKTREALNCRVIDSLKAAIALKKVVQAIMELIETPSNEVKTVMKNPSDTIEQNLEALATEMMDLQFCSSRVVRKEPKLMEGWLLESKQSAVTDFVEIQREWNKLKGDHLNNLKTREALNCRVIDSLKAAIALRKVVQAIMELIETLSNEVKTGEPKQEAVTHSKKEKEKEISLTGEKGDKPKPEGVTLLKEVMETSDLKIDKPTEFTPEEVKRFTMNFSNKAGYDQIRDVFEGRFSSGQQIFVTVLKEFGNIEENLFMAEVNKMFRISHKNMAKLYGFCFHRNIKAMVHEYVDNGSLDKILYYREHADLAWEKLYEIAIQTAMGLSYLHDGFHDPIVLGDFRTSDVLLDSNFSPKVAHFRVEKIMYGTHGTFAFTAPETWLLLSQITHKCDVYSFGIMLIEILYRGRYCLEWGLKRIWDMYQKGQLDELVDEWVVGDKNRGKAKVMCMVALWCIQFTPQTRPHMSTVVKMLTMEIPVVTPPDPFGYDSAYIISDLISSAD